MLKTYAGSWDAITWIIAFITIAIVVYIIRSFGRKDYRKGEAQKAFFSGEDVLSPEEMHVRASNIYWGFVEAMKGYYAWMRKIHNGIINDYIAWFVGVAAIMFIVFFIQEVIK
ncbi:MAG: FeoB-associated Cys-rich membrane protein [Thermoplasmata archaeon]|nr:FeoB-associated Cys-rich membrane protein [Thermoplasmata archaeon]